MVKAILVPTSEDRAFFISIMKGKVFDGFAKAVEFNTQAEMDAYSDGLMEMSNLEEVDAIDVKKRSGKFIITLKQGDDKHEVPLDTKEEVDAYKMGIEDGDGYISAHSGLFVEDDDRFQTVLNILKESNYEIRFSNEQADSPKA
jgi:hypothetical protein